MQDAELNYAKAGGPPWNWYEYYVVYEDNRIVPDCLECDVRFGYAVRYVRDENGKFNVDDSGEEIEKITEYGNYRIVHKDVFYQS